MLLNLSPFDLCKSNETIKIAVNEKENLFGLNPSSSKKAIKPRGAGIGF